MKVDPEAIAIVELKNYEYDLVDHGEAYKFDEVTRKIGDYVGRVYGKSMRNLVISLQEDENMKEPEYPTGNNPSEKDKAIWSKKYDHWLKKIESYDDYKAKVFVIVLGKCTKAMKNRLQKLGTFEDMEVKHNVIGLLKEIKRQIFDSHDNKYESLRSVMAWRKLMSCRQKDKEDLIDYYTRFCGLVEAVELSYGNIKPKGSGGEDKERSKFISMLFMAGTDGKQYSYLMKDLETNYSLGQRDVYPDGIEDALQVLILYSEQRLKALKKKANGKDDAPNTGTQLIQCWHCKEEGHQKKDCPVLKKKKEG